MISKIRKISAHYITATVVACLFAGSAMADHDDGERVKIKGEATAMFAHQAPNPPIQGRFASSIDLHGDFTILAGDMQRTGRFQFPHLLIANLEFPPPTEENPRPAPIFLNGDARGAIVWYFHDNGAVCDGKFGGDFDETGFNLLAKGKLDCTDGTRIRLKMRDITVREPMMPPPSTLVFEICLLGQRLR